MGSAQTDPNDPETPPWIEKVRCALGDRRAVGVVVAVSGGSDSVGMLLALHRLAPEFPLRLSVAHLDHGVRGSAGEADAQFVRSLAESLDLPFDLGNWSPKRPGHFESDARRARYAWLLEAATGRRAELVAVGHTREDQAETILHHVLRGTGLRGLAGMPQRRTLAAGVSLIRPILEVSRADVRTYLNDLGQDYRDDASNRDLARTRARIRHDLLPKLAADFNPRIVEALVRLGRHATAETKRLRRRLGRAWRSSGATASPQCVRFERAPFEKLSTEIRTELIRLAWRRAGWPERGMTSERWSRLAETEGASSRFSAGGGIEMSLTNDAVVLAPTAVETSPETSMPAHALFAEWLEWSPTTETAPGRHDDREPCTAKILNWARGRVVAGRALDERNDELIDWDRLDPWLDENGAFFLLVDAPRDGDRFAPLGMNGQSMALNDFFRARRVSQADRRRSLVVRDREGIVWVVGHRIADRVRRRATTRRVVALRWEQGDGPCR
jgi:tRNA(Ile)-lysidine synthase